MTPETRANILKHLKAPEGDDAEQWAGDLEFATRYATWTCQVRQQAILSESIAALADRCEAAERRVVELEAEDFQSIAKHYGGLIEEWANIHHPKDERGKSAALLLAEYIFANAPTTPKCQHGKRMGERCHECQEEIRGRLCLDRARLA